jgi:hypothetical protein
VTEAYLLLSLLLDTAISICLGRSRACSPALGGVIRDTRYYNAAADNDDIDLT